MRVCLHLVLFCCGALWAASACGDDSTSPAKPNDEAGVEYFEKQIRPVLAARCFSCHSEKANKREGGLILDRREGRQRGGEHGPLFLVGQPEQSLLVQAIRHQGDLQMPPDKRLSASVVAKFEHWVKIGAPDPGEPDPSPNEAEPNDIEGARSYWAFRPFDSTTPLRDEANWAASPIDAFVRAGLQQRGLSPVASAQRRVLIRRATYLLTGLPPSEEEVRRFLSDDRPDAFARLVDRLLARPQFGERWARHWLDLARYADSNGLDENFLFREAWRYRNWTIRAVNDDLPYDRFLQWQIAGDLLPHASVEERDQQRIASGFLVVGPKVLLGNDPRERVMDVADEQIDTIGKAVLGMTLGCARCHDHKFDPVPTTDYYALAGIFTSTQVMERRYMLGQQRTMERLVGLGAHGSEADDAYEKYWREKAKRAERFKQGTAALELLKKGKHEQLKEHAKKHPETVDVLALDLSLSRAERLAAQQAKVKLLTLAAKPRSIPPRAMIPSDSASPKDEKVRLAGQFDQTGDVSPRGFLTVLSTSPDPIPKDQSGRLQLARWLTDHQKGAGRLAARVLANRIWRHMMGEGLVRTVDNFGRTGEPPSHPRLLDYLAQRLIESNWSVKSLVREIALSRTFGLSSDHDEYGNRVDPGNRFYWRANRRRLDPESIRDSLLFTAGRLALAPMDSTVGYLGDQATAVGANTNRRRTDFPCRSVYLPVIRNDLPELFDVFDFADPHATTGARPSTIAAPQGLFLLNDTLVIDAARDAAARAVSESPSDEAVLAVLAQRMFGGPLPEEDRAAILEYVRTLREEQSAQGDAEARVEAWTLACQALFASSRFQILE